MELNVNTTLLLLIVLLAIPNLLYYIFSTRIDKSFYYREETTVSSACAHFSSKWIVITSVAPRPTEAILVLSKETEWNIVIVGDTKGPLEPLHPEWGQLPNVCVLTVEQQKRLPLRLLQNLPYRSYTRKMIGYLHAIKFGAEWIYDTDDDNHPIKRGLHHFDTESYHGMAYVGVTRKSSNLSNYVFNPYEYFGQPTMWPRGHPLSQIKIPNDVHQHKLCHSLSFPAVQQGLVGKDPDVDAIYRLINADPSAGLDISFSSVAPPIAVGPGVYAPFNSQNTLFHKSAFFGLFLPVTVAFRVTDIWRGYFTQKLLHLTGNFIAFYPVTARQVRNPHSYLSDFREEKALYYDAERVVELLSKWKCSRDDFVDCVLELNQLFVQNQFWESDETEVMQAWLSDLKSQGYEFPHLTTDANLFSQSNCRRSYLNFAVESSVNLQNRKNRNLVELVEWCNESTEEESQSLEEISLPFKEKSFQNGLQRKALIVTSNYQFFASVGVLDRLYDGYFAHVIYCGPFYPQFVYPKDSSEFPEARKVSFIHLYEREIHEGFFAYHCTTRAIEMRLENIEGFVVIADDAIYNLWNNIELNRFRLNGVTRRKGTWWKTPYGGAAVNSTISDLESRLQKDSALKDAWEKYEQGVGGDGFGVVSERDVWGVADWYYLPSANFSVFHELSKVFFENGVFHEIAVPKLAAGLGWIDFYLNENLDIPNSLHVWFKRSTWASMYHEKLIYFHPVKLSSFGKTLSRRFEFCQSVVSAFAKNLFGVSLTAFSETQHPRNKTEENPVLECCKQSSLPGSCFPLCNVEALSAKKMYELLTAAEPSCKMAPKEISEFVQCFTKQSTVNATLDETLNDSQFLPASETSSNSSSTSVPFTELDLTNTLQRCCYKKYVYRASRGKNCVDFCTGNLDLELLQTRRYVTCVEVLNDIIDCYALDN
ncbi:hypothetical protein QR680_001473 [Steinernema hermaphroditum]|uniref:Uncharacterized protein n=1 Tax=Steinernema hermaphroditum TaxID=289476 RepID=A0AA39LG04_9BILA|nr:hypothetical protein QR680_001473 [Steinernema hermaphroditum]